MTRLRPVKFRKHVYLELLYGNAIVGFVEPVRHVPSDGPKLSAFQCDGVEKRDSVQQFRKYLFFARTTFEKIMIPHGIRPVTSEHVCLQIVRLLVGHFDAVLEHGHWKLKPVDLLGLRTSNNYGVDTNLRLNFLAGTFSEEQLVNHNLNSLFVLGPLNESQMTSNCPIHEVAK